MSGNQGDLLGTQSAGIKPTGLINGASAFSVKSHPNLQLVSSSYSPLKVVSSPALTAGTLATILSLSGKGALSLLMCQAVDLTLRNLRMKLTIDGAVVFNATQLVNSASNFQFALGTCSIGTDGGAINDITFFESPIFFDQSCLVEFSSSVTETARSFIGYRYYPR